MEIAENNATAIMDMIARHAADDTMWDEPPLLFALGRTPEGDYGIAPARPWTNMMLDAMSNYRLPNILEAFPELMERFEKVAPGVDPAWVALRVAFEDPETRTLWFPDIVEGTEPCGIVLRTEVWAKAQPDDEVEVPKGSLADDPEAVEALIWLVVTYDDQLCQVVWRRGDASPQLDTWSFKSDFYREHKDAQRIPTAMRAMMRVNRRTLIQRRLRGEATGV